MIELSIPQAGEETKNSKDLVFSILSEQQPLTAIAIVNIIHKQYNVGLTYQAVKKAIDDLVAKGVLKRDGKEYRISKEWLFRLKSQVDRLLTLYEGGKTPAGFDAAEAKEAYAVYTFTNLFDLDNFWDDMLFHLTDSLSEKEHRSFLAHAHYGWWLLINLGRETRLFEHMIERNVECYNLFIGKWPLNLWAEDIYSGLGVRFRVIEDEGIEESVTLNVIGDTIIQVKYPEEILLKLRDFYAKYKSTQEMSLKEITQLAHEQCEIKFMVFKNPEIAQGLREKYMKYFE